MTDIFIKSHLTRQLKLVVPLKVIAVCMSVVPYEILAQYIPKYLG